MTYCLISNLSFGATITWDGTGDGVNWSDANNWDSGTIPTAADDALIDGFTVTLDITTTIQRVYVTGSGMLTIEAAATLNITGYTVDDEGFEVNNSAIVVNDGIINISNTNGGTGADGLYVRGTFTNNGTISIDGVGQHGLYIQRGNFTNSIGATVTVTNAGTLNGDGDCIYVDDSSEVPGLLTNFGTITLTTVVGSDDGIYVNDGSSLDNHGTLTISGTAKNGIRVDDGGIFNNLAGSILNVDGGTDDQIFLDNTCEFNNFGTINSTNADASDGAIDVTDAAKFYNKSSGIINITDATTYGVYVEKASSPLSAELINEGTITITDSSQDGIRVKTDALFTNSTSGIVNIISAAEESIRIEPTGTVNNMGTMDIDNPLDHGMEITGTFENSGSITIDDPADNGIYLTNAGIFNNNVGGTINTTNVEDHSIQVDANSNATPATFTNAGTITLTSSIDHALRLQEDAVFTNSAGGLVNIVSAARKGILMESGSTLNNSGTIDIPAAAEEGMDMIDGTFNNMVGGIYKATDTVDDGLEINGPSILNNDGILDIDGSGSEDIEIFYGPNFEVPGINHSSTATFAPGSSPGDLEIKGDFNLGDATITFEINGTTENDPTNGITGDFDQILNFSSSNFLMLNTSKAYLDWGTFIPEVGDKFKIIDGSGLTLGSFSEVTSSLPQLEFTTTNTGTEIEVEITAILPVKLAYFNAKKVDNTTHLSWQTASEINSKDFEIERSVDGSNWTKIGSLVSRGYSNYLVDYEYQDRNPQSGTNYYRLRQNDIDGQYEYSQVVSLDYGLRKIELSIYPNPVINTLYIESQEDVENATYNIFDVMGNRVWTYEGLLEKIDFSDMRSGVYFLEVVTANQRTVKKITK